jgi:acyl transferase domain-containing protein
MSPHATAIAGTSVDGRPVNGTDDINHGFTPTAICGMACRLPGGIRSPSQLWDFLLSKGDARSRVPESRYNIDAYYSPTNKPGTVKVSHGCFLDEDLTGFDASFFTMSPRELERCDPQQRQMLEVARECIEDAGETNWRGRQIGVYMGSYGEDWGDMFERDPQQYGIYRVTGSGDFVLANRVSYEMDLQGPRCVGPSPHGAARVVCSNLIELV